MFEKRNCPVHILNIAPATMEKDDAELTLLRLDCVIDPLTPELAGELDAEVRSTLFARKDGDLKRKVKSITWDRRELGIKTQKVDMRMAPDQADESFALAEAEVGDALKTSRTKDGKTWKLSFSLTVYPASEHQQAQIIDSFGKTRYCGFDPRQPDLFSPSTEKRAKAVQAERAQGIGAASATAH